ncbi:MAG: acyl-CoA dehydrogenase family protein [Bacteroidota bacterium]|nr:acyl-CoA dehydrogenase family protein [Candidatus Kapabacteria bacterium]MCS7302290.1 acyl-CoA dehydrogenase family protein [Candidatus Kapabacteria bacterium]MCX7936299.1 acyl-CoA dehydrogenase family protein [Chlorobiota bacterium]MDW8074419.1 acyl-CoA dehydrogenase family protein [Bacteroidota bacterium]MDW8271105.1 acyl-CoA dehydrogenase family protein [Bacteroidota bacterium]
MPFDGVDYYSVEDLYTPEERMVRDTVRDFVEREVIPVIEDAYQKAYFPMELVPKMAELGLFGMTLPQEYGGGGMNNVCYGLAMQELERGDSGVRSFASVQSSLVMYPIYTYGSEEQRRKWLPRLARGEVIGCFGLTEPDYGSNPAGMITTAKKINGGYLLNGAKMWITNGSIADVAVVWAKLDGEVHGFLVEKGMKGFSAPEMKNKHSLRASITSELIFQDVEIPEENILPNAKGLKAPLSCLTQARYGIAWGAIGAAMACYDAAVKYAKTRIQFGKPIGAFQLIQEKLAYMLTEITKGQLLCWRLAKLKDEGKLRPQHVSLAKRNNVAVALEIARLARDIHGANGIISEYPVMRHMLNLESVKTYEGTHEIHTLILGADITGIQAFS